MQTPGQVIKILVADDCVMFRDALCTLLELEPDLTVAGQAGDGQEALEQMAALKPDLVLLDLAMPRMSGLDVLRRLNETNDVTPVLVIATRIENQQMLEAVQLGARGFLLKEAAPEFLFKGVRAAFAGEYWIGHRDMVDLIAAFRASAKATDGQEVNGCSSLTIREQQIVAAIVDGCTNKDIADILSIGGQTVKNHLTNIYRKLDVSNRLELALLGMRRTFSDGS